MVIQYKPGLVSEYTTPTAMEGNAYYKDGSYARPEFKLFAEAVAKAMGDVSLYYKDYGTAVVYRPGDIHDLGEIGYKTAQVKTRGDTGSPSYYVRAEGIYNTAYRDTIWQHNIVATKSMKNAVKNAVQRLSNAQLEGRDVKLTVEAARRVIERSLAESQTALRSVFRQLTGEGGYGNYFDSELFRELRTHTFISAELNQNMAKFYSALDIANDAKALVKDGMLYVGVSDNYGQTVADIAHCATNSGTLPGELTRMPVEALPDWVQGRIAMLQMVGASTYAAGVGLRLDEKVYYVLKGDDE